MRLQLVPFNPQWPSALGPSGAPLLDIKAIYRRPRKTMLGDFILDPAGFLQWDLTGGLPVQHHQKWTARGFEYVTLATREDLIAVADPNLREQGVQPLQDWRQYVQNRATDGPWDAAAYLADLKEATTARHEALIDAIARFGPEAAEQIEQRTWSAYRLPASFRPAPSEPADDAPVKRGRPAKAVAVPA